MRSRKTRPIVGMMLGACAVAAVTVFRLWATPRLGPDAPVLLYFCAVLFAAMFGGMWAGIFTTLLTVLAGVARLVGTDPSALSVIGQVRLAVLAVQGTVVSVLLGVLQKRTKALRELSDRLREGKHAAETIALEDALTGLGNRRNFDREFARALALADREAKPITVAIADVDGLKRTNDDLGHDVGDQLLKAVSQALSDSCRSADAVYRVGGDEFAILLPDVNRAQFDLFVGRLLTALDIVRTRYPIAGASIGAAHYPEDGVQAEVLYRMADERMYRQKAIHATGAWRR